MPTSGRYALDTNVAIAVLNGEPACVTRWREEPEVLLPAPVLAELAYGALRSARAPENLGRVRELARSMPLVVCDAPVCYRFGSLKAELARTGRPIPANDIWVAACCLEANATLVSRDRHFDGIPELRREEW